MLFVVAICAVVSLGISFVFQQNHMANRILHPGGFFAAFTDQRVWFLSNETPYSKLSLFFTVDGTVNTAAVLRFPRYRGCDVLS